MSTSTVRPLVPDRNAAVYWRRRFVVLVIGLSVLALVSWAVAGLLGDSISASHPAARRSVHRELSRTSATAASTAVTELVAVAGLKQFWLARAALTRPGDVAAALRQPGPSARRQRGPGQARAGPKQSRHAAATLSHPGRAADRGRLLRSCPAGDVVLSVFSSQTRYSARQAPEFEIDVVSTATRPCAFDVGARHLFLRITAGPARVWTSAQCSKGPASLVARLHRGVPTVVPITWNRRHSSPGCPVPGREAAAGTYTATATAAGGVQASSPLSVRLG